MKYVVVLAGLSLLSLSTVTEAGAIVGGAWAPSGCGQKPPAPVIDDKTVESFNKSVAGLNDWQLQSKSYFECLVKEANADNALIAESANREQSSYRQTVDSINATLDAAEKKLSKKP